MAKKLIQLYSIIIALCMTTVLHSQVVLVPELQGSGIILKQQVWSVAINNLSAQPINSMLSITVTDRNTNQPLLQATSGMILLNAGLKRVTYNDLAPLNYSVAAAGFAMDRQLNQPLPVGEYLVCYRLTDIIKNLELVTECVKISSDPLAPPQLIQPADGSLIQDPRPALTWTPPAPVYMFNSLSYDIIVSPLYDNQSPQEALQRNIPVMTTSSTSNSILYPPSHTNLVPGRTYAWQVLAKDAANYGGKSEVWTFTVMPDSVSKIISDAPYVKMSAQRNDATVLHQNMLKMEYYNALPDSTVKGELYMITGGSSKQKRFAQNFVLKIRPGQNFLEHSISNRMRLSEGNLYEVRLTNSRNESLYMRFTPKYYF